MTSACHLQHDPHAVLSVPRQDISSTVRRVGKTRRRSIRFVLVQRWIPRDERKAANDVSGSGHDGGVPVLCGGHAKANVGESLAVSR